MICPRVSRDREDVMDKHFPRERRYTMSTQRPIRFPIPYTPVGPYLHPEGIFETTVYRVDHVGNLITVGAPEPDFGYATLKLPEIHPEIKRLGTVTLNLETNLVLTARPSGHPAYLLEEDLRKLNDTNLDRLNVRRNRISLVGRIVAVTVSRMVCRLDDLDGREVTLDWVGTAPSSLSVSARLFISLEDGYCVVR